MSETTNNTLEEKLAAMPIPDLLKLSSLFSSMTETTGMEEFVEQSGKACRILRSAGITTDAGAGSEFQPPDGGWAEGELEAARETARLVDEENRRLVAEARKLAGTRNDFLKHVISGDSSYERGIQAIEEEVFSMFLAPTPPETSSADCRPVLATGDDAASTGDGVLLHSEKNPGPGSAGEGGDDYDVAQMARELRGGQANELDDLKAGIAKLRTRLEELRDATQSASNMAESVGARNVSEGMADAYEKSLSVIDAIFGEAVKS